jgi:hypothetical protein
MKARQLVVLSLAIMRGVYGKRIAYLGFATGVLDIIGAYPDAIGPTLTLVCQVFFAAWFVAVGSKLYACDSWSTLRTTTSGDAAPVA